MNCIEGRNPQKWKRIRGRFVLAAKNGNKDDEVLKARFVVQGHTDIEKNFLVHNSTNLRQSYFRVLVAIAAVSRFRSWSQDLSQAYLQSADKLMREVYVKRTKEFRLPPGRLLKLLNPLHGLSDSGDYWHSTFSEHLINDLHMMKTAEGSSFFFRIVDGKLRGMTGAYVDDTISTGDKTFEEESKMTGERFQLMNCKVSSSSVSKLKTLKMDT